VGAGGFERATTGDRGKKNRDEARRRLKVTRMMTARARALMTAARPVVF
jgi:hypothetical protein